MEHSADFSRAIRIEAERRLLATLCQPTVSPETRATILKRLKNHSFCEPDYQVIYRALAEMPPASLEHAHQSLAQAVTRLGFPDVDSDALFKEPALTDSEISEFLNRLL